MIAILNGAIWTGWGGFVLAQLWGWFLVPLGVTSISWWHAAGLSATYILLSRGAPAYATIAAYKAMDLGTEHSEWVSLAMAVIIPAISLCAGWLIKTLGPILDSAL